MTDLQTIPEPAVEPAAPPVASAQNTPQTQFVAREPAERAPGAPRLEFRLLGMAAAVAALAGAMTLMGCHPSDMLQVTGLLVVAALSVFGLIVSHGPRMFGRFVAIAFGSCAIDEAEADCLRAMCRRGRQLCYSGGVLGMLLGVIHVMSVLDQPALIGPGLAVALVTPVIAILFAELGFGAAVHWVRTKRD